MDKKETQLSTTSTAHGMPVRRSQMRMYRDGNHVEMSLYDDSPVTESTGKAQMKMLSIAFPAMKPEFFVLLFKFIRESGFTEKRLKDAVGHVIKTFRYRELNISDIISYDRLVKLYTGSQFVNAQMNGTPASDFERLEVDGTMYWVLKVDMLNAKLQAVTNMENK